MGQAIGDQEMTRENLEMFYRLASISQQNDQIAEAVELFEKILAFDYHYQDGETRLLEAKEILKDLPTDTTQESGTLRAPVIVSNAGFSDRGVASAETV